MTANQLQRLIDNAGKTQAGLARELHIALRTMRYYLSGDRPIPEVVAIAARCLCQHPHTQEKPHG